MNRILHPTDFSENATEALKYALSLSRKFDAELILLHISDFRTVMNSPSELSSFSEMEEEEKRSVAGKLKDYIANSLVEKNHSGKIVLEVRLNSSVVKGIVEVISETDADMVVIGTKGQSKLKEVIMGSTAKGLVQYAPCPVLIIPEQATVRDFKHIVYCSDFNQHDVKALERLLSLAKVFNPEMSVLHVFKDEAMKEANTLAFERFLSEQAEYSRFKYETRVSGNIAEALASYLQFKEADLLVMFEKENMGIINILFHKDMVKEFATHTQIPLLSYNMLSLGTGKDA